MHETPYYESRIAWEKQRHGAMVTYAALYRGKSLRVIPHFGQWVAKMDGKEVGRTALPDLAQSMIEQLIRKES